MSGQQTWGGRFTGLPSPVMQQINQSIDVDRRLYREDIAGSLAHGAMLARQGILSPEDWAQMERGLKQIRAEIESGDFVFRPELEDIHMNIEARLTELIGPAAGRLHTARSRNDQVATDFRIWVREHARRILEQIDRLLGVLEVQKERHRETLMPGFTHLQSAQPVTFALHLDVYTQMLKRDRGRLLDGLERWNECPLGAGALAGTSYPIDRAYTSAELGFAGPMENPMDAVSDRDFALEYLSALSICALHLSRLGEELVLWSSYQFQFVYLGDAFTTGSSMMPQKRNPDAAELLRAKAGSVLGQLIQLSVVFKGLPLTYSKDMQEDKKPVFEATDTLLLCLRAAAGMIEGMEVHRDSMLRALESGYTNATYLADWLVSHLGLPFRQAHHLVGRLVLRAEELGQKLEEMDLTEMRQIVPEIDEGVFEALSYTAAKADRSER